MAAREATVDELLTGLHFRSADERRWRQCERNRKIQRAIKCRRLKHDAKETETDIVIS
jgi:hypothetical protein